MNLMRARVIALVVVLLAVVVLLTLCMREPDAGPSDEGAAVEELGEGVQSVLLAFASKGAWRMIEERREIVGMDDQASRAHRIMEELAAGPVRDDADGTIPAGTNVLSVFFDGTGGAFVDFSSEFTENHPGGSSGELFTIRRRRLSEAPVPSRRMVPSRVPSPVNRALSLATRGDSSGGL